MKKFTIILMLALMVSVALGLPFHNVQVKDEDGRKVTNISSVEIYAPGTSTNAVIYADRALQNVITIPMTTSSTNTTLSNGQFFWYGPDGYDFSITDGTNIMNNSGNLTRNSSGNQMTFPTYLTSISSTTYSDAQSATWGTSGDFVQSAGTVAGTLTFVPGADDNIFNIGNSGTALNSNFNVFNGTALGFKLSSSGATHSLTYDGGIANLNASSNFAVNIATGTSTGATTIGNSAGGAVAIDTDTGITVNADDSYALTVSAGTVSIAPTGGDLTLDATDKSVIVRGSEAATDAVLLDADNAAGGVTVQCGTGDITLDSGDDIFLAADTGTGDVISLINTQGTAEGATIIRSVAGGIDVDFATAKNMAVTGGQFIFTSNEDVASAFSVITNTGTSETITLVNTQGTGTGAITLTTTAAGDLDFNSGDDITIDAADDMITTVVGDYTLAVTGTTILPNDVLLKTTTALTHDHMDNLAATPKQVVAAVAGNTIEFVSAVLALDWGATAWTEASAPDDLVIRYENGTGPIVSQLLDATGFATATEDTVVFLGPNVANAAGAAVASVAATEANTTNKGLFLDNTGDEWTNSGDSQVVVIVYYRLHTTAELGM